MDIPLPSTYDLWCFDVHDVKETTEETFFEKIRKTIKIKTLADLVTFYSNFKKPKSMPGNCEVYLFKENIKPLWEDEKNIGGGSFFLHIKKTFANKIWENLLISVVSESEPELKCINGVIMRIQRLEVVFFVWTSKLKKCDEIKLIQWLKDTAGLSSKIKLEFKPHPKQADKDEEKEIPVKTEITLPNNKKPFGKFDSDDGL